MDSEANMLRTALCDLLGIDHPVIQAAMGFPATSATLAAAVSNEGGLGSIGTLNRPIDDLRRQLNMLRDLTSRPYAVNHLIPVLEEASFALSLEAHPKLISFALDDPGDFVQRAHDSGALVMHQITTVKQAEEAVERRVDVIVAQGEESGGYSGTVSTMALVPQVVDAVSPVPVVAAGGIFDGRGLAAALMLGAAGVNLGTRFLVSQEAPIDEEHKKAILGAASEDAVKFEELNAIRPLPGAAGYGTVVRSLRTSFIDQWRGKFEEAQHERGRLDEEMQALAQKSGRNRAMVVSGQSAGGISEILSVREILSELVSDAEKAILEAAALLTPKASIG
jgi:enoyl-[acyl-carrier protein] reductase II